MQVIKNYVKENSKILFKYQVDSSQSVIFDHKGFFFSTETQKIYDQIKDQPHLYVAWTKNQRGYYYVGSSFQDGGRWKRQHSYHLGTLAYHFLKTIRSYDQNHAHWIDHWMNPLSVKKIDTNTYSVELKESVYICFIPFDCYSDKDFRNISKKTIQNINRDIKTKLIQSYQEDNISLLNVRYPSSTLLRDDFSKDKIKREVENLIAGDELNQAIDLMREYSSSNGQGAIIGELIVLSGRFTDVQRSERLNLLPQESILLEKNRIRASLITILNLIFRTPPSKNQE